MNSICFDTETTGLHPNGSDPDEILTISIIGRDGSVLFGARAEALAPYLTKGKKVSVDGRLRYHSWMKNEEKRHALSVLVTDIEFADSKGVGKDTVSAKGQSAEPETYDADIPF